METVPLGDSGMEVSRFCFGTWNFNSKSPDWGPSREQEAIDLVRYVLDRGCTFFDTARGYGDSEEILGRALEGRRDGVVVATKMVQCEPEEVAPTVETSLRNLRTDVIDLYICHWPAPSKSLDAWFEAMLRMVEQGKVRALGVSNFDLEQMRIARGYGAVSLQPPLSILWRTPDGLLEYCAEEDVTVTPYSPTAQGMLTGRYTRDGVDAKTGPRKSNLLFGDDLLPQSLETARELDRIADDLGVSSARAAVAWVLTRPGRIVPIIGASRREHWDDNVQALDVTLPPDAVARLDEMGRAVWEAAGGADAAMWGWKPA